MKNGKLDFFTLVACCEFGDGAIASTRSFMVVFVLSKPDQARERVAMTQLPADLGKKTSALGLRRLQTLNL